MGGLLWRGHRLRYKITLEYDGGPFCGWQRQDALLSVQAVVEQALAALNHQMPVASICAGRTDAGVHAKGQVIHADLDRTISDHHLREAMNFHLRPHPVAVVEAGVVAETFSARFDAIARQYRYRILNRRARPALEANRVWHVPYPLDIGAMQAASRYLCGHHDFDSFRSAACQAKHGRRTIDRISWQQEGDMLIMTVQARSFLHHQVRNFVGSLVEVGKGKYPPEWIQTVLQMRDRTRAGPTAPPEGLYFWQVEY